MVVGTVYYPGWEVRIDGRKTSLIDLEQSSGLIGFNLPLGKHIVEIIWMETGLRVIANSITIVAFLGIVGYMIKKIWERFI